MKYTSPKALEMAMKEAAKKSPIDTNRAIASFYLHRFLCRVFVKSGSPFALKGGQSVLARTIDARATRDIDLTTSKLNLEDALNELKRLAVINLGDYIFFSFVEAKPIKNEDEYREGYAVKFDAFLGPKKMQTVSVDLVSDEISCEVLETITPTDRLVIDGLEVSDYQVYPAERSIADKICAILERHNGRASSRVKDLVDIVILASNISFERKALSTAIKREMKARRLSEGVPFSIPDEWEQTQENQYSQLIANMRIAEKASSIQAAEAIARALVDPCLVHGDVNFVWNPKALEWEMQ